MGLDMQRLEELKEKTQTDDDFGAIWKYFFDHFGENPEFMTMGQRADEDMVSFLEPILESVCKRAVNRDVMVAQFILTEVPDTRFFHGPCLTDAGIAVVFYFDDVKTGMVSLTPSLGTGLVHYARFSTLAVADKRSFFLQSKSNTSH
jgi:hypothetical protein